MKYTASCIFGLLLSGVCIARADLDLTPIQQTHMMESTPIKQIVFQDGTKEVIYEPPHGWVCTGSHTSAALSIPDHPQAKATIQSAPKLRIPAFDDTAENLFEKNPGLLQLPKGALNVKITGVTQNPLVIDGHKTLEVQMTYSFFGQACEKSIVLVDRNGAEVSFSLDTLAPDFEPLEAAFHRSLYSIENL